MKRAAGMTWDRIGRLVGLALLGTLAAVWIWFAFRKPDLSTSPTTDQVAPVPLPSLTASPYLNTQPEVGYVGTERCVSCHAEQHASYLATAHSRSLSLVDPGREPADAVFDHAASNRRYHVYRQDGKLRHRESLLLADGAELELCDFPLKFLVGSGHFTRTYVVEDAGFLIESPVTWYASLNKWAMSPGYDRPAHRSFHRTIEQACLFCHAGAVEPVAGNEQRLRLGDLAIGCERCHGPGELHVAHWTANTGDPNASSAIVSPQIVRATGSASAIPDTGDRTIVHPQRLPRDLAESICQQCHLTGATQVAVRGRRAEDYRPGLRWSDFVVDYDYETRGTEMTVVGHVSQMRQSKCYQASDTLTCVTCHEPHATATSPAERIASIRATCSRCHADPSCSAALSEPERNNRNCATCHMPQSPTDIQHVAFTHHRIGLHDPAKRPVESSSLNDFRPLVPVLDVSQLPEVDRQRTLGLAYLKYSRDHEHSAHDYLAAARPLIEESIAHGLMDASLTLAKAELAAVAGESDTIEQWARESLSAAHLTGNERIMALRLLAGLALQESHFAEAATHLEELVKLARDPRDWFLLGVCRARQGDIVAAAAALERVIEIDPAQPETYDFLGPLYRASNPDRAAWCLQRAESIRRSARQAAD